MFLDFYGFREQPFSPTPDPRFLYSSPTHKEALASLHCGFESGVGFMALVAAPGMGKTTLLLQLLGTFSDTVKTVFLFQTQCNSRELIRYILDDLGMDASTNDIVAIHQQLREFLLTESQAGRRVILVIDEAHNLEDSALETLRLLSNFEKPNAKLLQIVLSGQPGLGVKLLKPNLIQLRQRMSALIRLEALSLEEVNDYIDYRLKVAGYRGAPLFTPSAYRVIGAASGGVPRVVNNLCFNALSIGCALQTRLVDAPIAQEAADDLTAGFLGAKCLVSMPGERSDPKEGRQSTWTEAAVNTKPQPLVSSGTAQQNPAVGFTGQAQQLDWNPENVEQANANPAYSTQLSKNRRDETMSGAREYLRPLGKDRLSSRPGRAKMLFVLAIVVSVGAGVWSNKSQRHVAFVANHNGTLREDPRTPNGRPSGVPAPALKEVQPKKEEEQRSITSASRTAVSPGQQSSSLGDKLRQSLGLSQEPDQPQGQGSPALRVWVDLHTGLYYCPGANAYGKTRKGKFLSQKEAQFDYFVPASRIVCK